MEMNELMKTVKAILKMLTVVIATWGLIVFVLYFFTGSFKSAIPVGIFALIAMAKWCISDIKNFKE